MSSCGEYSRGEACRVSPLSLASPYGAPCFGFSCCGNESMESWRNVIPALRSTRLDSTKRWRRGSRRGNPPTTHPSLGIVRKGDPVVSISGRINHTGAPVKRRQESRSTVMGKVLRTKGPAYLDQDLIPRDRRQGERQVRLPRPLEGCA